MEAKVDIRKLQLLNDRISQTIEALNQVRLSVHGLSHTAGVPGQVPGLGYGYGVNVPFGVPQQLPARRATARATASASAACSKGSAASAA